MTAIFVITMILDGFDKRFSQNEVAEKLDVQQSASVSNSQTLKKAETNRAYIDPELEVDENTNYCSAERWKAIIRYIDMACSF